MKCPFCGHGKDYVVDSRASPDGRFVRRRRKCERCRRRYTTYEYIEEMTPVVVKRSGRREPFDRAKLRASLVKACAKYSPAFAAVDEIVADIESVIQKRAEKEVPAAELAGFVLERLSEVDQATFVRYRIGQGQVPNLQDLSALMSALMRELNAEKPGPPKTRRPLARVAGRRP